ncbi:MAG: hypothetical protein JXA96_15420 [Sedimentisphaerales bacterium]|nr:hypothetical protein [Sedimentisphaerales bacterium]
MENKLRFILLAMLFSLVAMTFGNESEPVDQKQIEWFGNSTLKGVREIYPQVALEIVEKDTTKSTFTPQIGPLKQKNLQQQLEKMLKESGIRITNKFDAKSTDAPLSLNVTIFARVRNDTALPSYGIFVYTEALQPEIIIRDAKIRSFSRTWPMVPMGDGTRALLFCTAETIDDEITREVIQQVRNFIIDYSNANPSRRIVVPQPDSGQPEASPETPEQNVM